MKKATCPGSARRMNGQPQCRNQDLPAARRLQRLPGAPAPGRWEGGGLARVTYGFSDAVPETSQEDLAIPFPVEILVHSSQVIPTTRPILLIEVLGIEFTAFTLRGTRESDRTATAHAEAPWRFLGAATTPPSGSHPARLSPRIPESATRVLERDLRMSQGPQAPPPRPGHLEALPALLVRKEEERRGESWAEPRRRRAPSAGRRRTGSTGTNSGVLVKVQ
ncbi:PREDICTED: uncharacterized protein LOC102029960 [Chinchilla lanigera]|uniref:uncharacterized protein LOC102029960 n=1 Tax=Chinchilla lanigera TaxID=34839 RepID=UPI00038EA2BB|nr:PREDICTED: uncharacterized protein LOC102029960 [Chinchilla lanigera]